MSSTPDRDLIRSKLDVELSDGDLDYLLERMERIEGQADTTIFERDKKGDALYLLVEGTMSAHVNAEGRRLVLGKMNPGDWIGELQFIEPGTSSASVTSDGPFVALRLASGQVDELIDGNPAAAGALIRTLSREIAERLARTSSGVLQRVADGKFKVADAQQRRGWFSGLLANLFGSGQQA